MTRTLTLGHLYPDHMNLYGDRGNVIALVRRAQWRGIDLRVIAIDVGQPVAFDQLDLLFMGGGEDRDQARVAKDFLERGLVLRPYLEAGLPMLAVCGAYQLLGAYYVTADGQRLPGLGFLPVHTVAGARRSIGNVVAEIRPHAEWPPGLAGSTLVGFENHAGQTFLEPGALPLAHVLTGSGNNGQDGTEGAVRQHVIGTYLHGSLLPKNPHLADCLLAWAAARKGWQLDSALDDRLEWSAHRALLRRFHKRGLGGRHP
ncbi:MAG: glutamine amidotransferase [Firmicutes bacterium]|nr:glutamine amidotransferase [Alicyclobacillaceae bacterium]MCL6496575.1 glutamine amidotransferase [Bacillota bacterium]